MNLSPEPGQKPRMKGIGFVNVRNYVLETHGAERWQEVLQTLTGSDKHEVEAAVAVGWYDVAHFAKLLRSIDEVCGRGDLRLLEKVGAYEAEQDFNRVLRVFLRVLSPGYIFKAEARLWSHFQDSGTWNSVKVDGGVNATLQGWAVDAALCRELAGYLVKVVEFTGGRSVSVEHNTCRALGDSRCVFEYRWL
jgi:hypothetical protein